MRASNPDRERIVGAALNAIKISSIHSDVSRIKRDASLDQSVKLVPDTIQRIDQASKDVDPFKQEIAVGSNLEPRVARLGGSLRSSNCAFARRGWRRCWRLVVLRRNRRRSSDNAELGSHSH